LIPDHVLASQHIHLVGGSRGDENMVKNSAAPIARDPHDRHCC
jgi:hypothetical protein